MAGADAGTTAAGLAVSTLGAVATGGALPWVALGLQALGIGVSAATAPQAPRSAMDEFWDRMTERMVQFRDRREITQGRTPELQTDMVVQREQEGVPNFVKGFVENNVRKQIKSGQRKMEALSINPPPRDPLQKHRGKFVDIKKSIQQGLA